MHAARVAAAAAIIACVGCSPNMDAGKVKSPAGGIPTSGASTKSLSRADRAALKRIIDQIRRDRTTIEANADANAETDEKKLDKGNVVNVLNYGNALANEEIRTLKKFDEMTGWNDARTIEAATAWRKASVDPITSQAPPYQCGFWEHGSCKDTLAIPIKNQIAKLHPILEHGLNRIEDYLKMQ